MLFRSGIAPALHHAAGELVDDDDLAVLDDIVDVAAEHGVRLERLVEVVDNLRVGDVVEVLALDQAGFLEQPLGLFGAFLGQADRFGLFVLFIFRRATLNSKKKSF